MVIYSLCCLIKASLHLQIYSGIINKATITTNCSIKVWQNDCNQQSVDTTLLSTKIKWECAQARGEGKVWRDDGQRGKDRNMTHDI